MVQVNVSHGFVMVEDSDGSGSSLWLELFRACLFRNYGFVTDWHSFEQSVRHESGAGQMNLRWCRADIEVMWFCLLFDEHVRMMCVTWLVWCIDRSLILNSYKTNRLITVNGSWLRIQMVRVARFWLELFRACLFRNYGFVGDCHSFVGPNKLKMRR